MLSWIEKSTKLNAINTKAPAPAAPALSPDTILYDLDLPVRFYNSICLTVAHVLQKTIQTVTIKDLLTFSQQEYLQMRSVGKKTIEEADKLLSAAGLKWIKQGNSKIINFNQ